ncbi:hypothetical protein D7U98_13030 [Stenotrophomonas maltophilia]|uniref:hypothetical protein n=1 Tax=Stenotrophomonas maltophilia TaxID=40324 RepID=UPI0015DFE541|nr:hypothetical protein [Stenotrophomonas maltophilia]MBA0396313.1 hypothetical protein [Stenotrophomonas maltophilia]
MPTEPRFAHAYDPATRAHMGPVRLQPSPDGAWHLPDGTVDVAPQQAAGQCQALRLADDGSRWELVADFRNRMLWDTATAMPVPNRLALGEPLPSSVTLAEPIRLDGTTPHCNAWDAVRGEWTLQPDYSGRPIWNKADGSFAAPLQRGQPLPATVTDHAPPTDRSAPIGYDDAASAWLEIAVSDTTASHPN